MKKLGLKLTLSLSALAMLATPVFASDTSVGGWTHVDDYGNPRSGVINPDGTRIHLPTFAEVFSQMDYDTATPEVRELILDARYRVIFSNDVAWTVDGQVGIIHPDGTRETLPEFSDLFPDWDLDKITERAGHNFSNLDLVEDAASARSLFFNQNRSLPRENPNQQAPVFHEFQGQGREISVTPMSSSSGSRVNIGFSNSFGNVGWASNLAIGQPTFLMELQGIDYGIRGSGTTDATTSRIEMRRH